MDISLIIVLYLLSAHFIADFLAQTTYMGTMKSKDNAVLLLHTATYTGLMFGFSVFIADFSVTDMFTFAGVNFIVHTIQDFITSRLTSYQFSRKKYNGLTGAFTIIGFDQLLHYFQIFLTYYYLINH